MNWILLSLAIVFEVIGTISLKLSHGFTILWPTVTVVVGYGASFILLAQVLKAMNVGTAYAVWSGLGTALVAIAGVFLFKEPVTIVRVVSVVLIIVGVVGLHIAEAGPNTG